ncbi:hypothetical protein KAI87_07365, partial [Myxococcota bacterium]|nr:hypothetical protein [Myxococcota bacterium]
MATKLKSVETETTPPRRFPVAARRAFSKRDSALLTAVLRQDFRWRDCGLDAPPREALLDEELFVSDPKKHKAKPGYTLIFDNAVVPSHLMAVLVDYGKTRSSDKNRVEELILLDRRSRARALSDKILKAGLSVVFRQGKAKSIMARVNGGPYSLAKLVGNSPGIEQIIEEELPWVFFKPDDLPVSLRPDDRVILPDTAQISADDMSDLLA